MVEHPVKIVGPEVSIVGMIGQKTTSNSRNSCSKPVRYVRYFCRAEVVARPLDDLELARTVGH
jgi:hypothetical protein